MTPPRRARFEGTDSALACHRSLLSRASEAAALSEARASQATALSEARAESDRERARHEAALETARRTASAAIRKVGGGGANGEPPRTGWATPPTDGKTPSRARPLVCGALSLVCGVTRERNDAIWLHAVRAWYHLLHTRTPLWRAVKRYGSRLGRGALAKLTVATGPPAACGDDHHRGMRRPAGARRAAPRRDAEARADAEAHAEMLASAARDADALSARLAASEAARAEGQETAARLSATIAERDDALHAAATAAAVMTSEVRIGVRVRVWRGAERQAILGSGLHEKTLTDECSPEEESVIKGTAKGGCVA